MGLTEQLAEWVLAFPKADNLPAEAKQRAKYLLLDTIGCALGAVPSETLAATWLPFMPTEFRRLGELGLDTS